MRWIQKKVDPAKLQAAKDKEIQGWAEHNVYTAITEREGIAKVKAKKAVLIDHRWVVTEKVDKDSPVEAMKVKARAVLKGFQDRRVEVSRNAPTASTPTVWLFWYLA